MVVSCKYLYILEVNEVRAEEVKNFTREVLPKIETEVAVKTEMKK